MGSEAVHRVTDSSLAPVVEEQRAVGRARTAIAAVDCELASLEVQPDIRVESHLRGGRSTEVQECTRGGRNRFDTDEPATLGRKVEGRSRKGRGKVAERPRNDRGKVDMWREVQVAHVEGRGCAGRGCE